MNKSLVEKMTEVVAALIWDRDKFMICQRPAYKDLLVERWSQAKPRNKHLSESARKNWPLLWM